MREDHREINMAGGPAPAVIGDPERHRHGLDILELLLQMLESRLPFIRGRAKRVQAVSSIMARRLGLAKPQRQLLELASRFNDIGLLAIPDALLLREGKLSARELLLIRRHSNAFGSRLLQRVLVDLPQVSFIVHRQGERSLADVPSGTNRLIAQAGAILCLSQSIEAMANDRPHRPALPLDSIIQELRSNVNHQFSRETVEAFLRDPKALYEAACHGQASGEEVATSTPADAPRPTSVSEPVASAGGEVQPDVAAPILTAAECRRRLEEGFRQKAPSPIVTKVVGLAASPRTDLKELTDMIATDAVLSARVIQMANSAAMSGGCKLAKTLSDAVRKIGCAGVRNIALTLGVFDAMPAGGSEQFDVISYWQHSLAVARLCELLVGDQDPELLATAYLAGLCHELGPMLFHSNFGPEYAKVKMAHDKTKLPLDRLERQMLGMTQKELVTMALAAIGLPDTIRQPIEAIGSGTESQQRKNPLAAVLRAAELLANGLHLAISSQSVVGPLSALEYKRAVCGREGQVYLDAAGFRSDIVCATVMLARLSDAQQRQLLGRISPGRAGGVWLAREAIFIDPDPLLLALEVLAQPVVHGRLPGPQELSGLQALVVCVNTTEGKLGAEVLRAAAAGSLGVPTLLLTRSRPPQENAEGGLVIRQLPLLLDDIEQFLRSASEAERSSADLHASRCLDAA